MVEMFNLLKNIFYQIPSSYSCKGAIEDRKELNELQKLIQQRIEYLNQLNLDTNADSVLLKHYELHAKIQDCIFADHSMQYILVATIVSSVAIIVFIRWYMLRKISKPDK